MFFVEEKLNLRLEEIKEYIYTDKEEITKYKAKLGNFKGGESVNLDDSNWDDFSTDQWWGGYDVYTWFRTKFTISQRFAGKRVAFYLITEDTFAWKKKAEYLIFLNGKPVQGLDIFHQELLLTENAVGGEVYNLAIRAFSGLKEEQSRTKTRLVVIDTETEDFYFNARIAYGVVIELDKEDEDRIRILNILNDAFNLMDLRVPLSREFNESIKKANQYLKDNVYDKLGNKSDVSLSAVGHSHIDVAWLWQLSHTREKCSRSFSTVLKLMEQYPEYKFFQSQPQLYKFIKEDYPEIYEKIKAKIKEGRWEPEGGMWVEADCNVTSGESLIRQFLFGKRFFKSEFGTDSKVLWLPDVFGYNGAMPQILKKSGIDYFMTTKISWNQFNNMPYDTFMWRGIDGTEILTHYVTTPDFKPGAASGLPYKKTYNGNLIPKAVMGSWKAYKQKDINNEQLMPFGWGDGGGGPTKEMLENAKRLKNFPKCPKVKIGKVREYFDSLNDKVKDNKNLPLWDGELYLEYHRGTYTTMGRNKRFNRKSEFLYLAAETFSIMDMLNGSFYPQNKLNKGWELILLNQFHDIIPGSSIKAVYEDSLQQYKEIIKDGEAVLYGAIESTVRNINLSNDAVIVFNPLSNSRNGIVEVEMPDKYSFDILDDAGQSIQYQMIKDEDKAKIVFFGEDLPSKGYKSYYINGKGTVDKEAQSTMTVRQDYLENQFFSIELDQYGNMSSIHDKRNNRDVIKRGKTANVLQAFEDKPMNFDAWDVDIYYQEKMWEVNDVESIEVLDQGPVMGRIRINKRFLNSVICQDIIIYNDIPRIDFKTLIDWKESQIMLKAAFPVEINSSRATYEIQYGNVERNTHWNTSWDLAKFEVVGHKWVDISEGDYGVSLLNDCKYGYDVKDSQLRITLLRSPIDPNPAADKEKHEFIYSLYPHKGDWRDGKTVSMAYALNCPPVAKFEKAHKGMLPGKMTLAEVDKDNVVIEVIKKAEDSNDVIIRLYESYNQRGKVTLKFAKDIKEIYECDAMEAEEMKLQSQGREFVFDIKPFEIKTFKLKL